MAAAFDASALVPEVKLWLRIQTDGMNGELIQLAEACRLDLLSGGVREVDPSDPLIRQAVKLYCKAHFGYDDGAERFSRAYEALKASLSLSGDYNKEGV